MHAMWGRWAPPKERSRLTAITYSGQIQSSKLHTYIHNCYRFNFSVCVAGPYVGNVLSFPLSALLCQYGFDGGWPSVFYVFGKPQKSLSMALRLIIYPHWASRITTNYLVVVEFKLVIVN